VNYRHAFHAGGIGDCLKHALLVHLLGALLRKPRPVFVLDTHAGAGAYDPAAPEPGRTNEWRDGIGRLLENPPAALQDYVGLVSRLGLYPGSPVLIRAMLRPLDRLACCELHPAEHAQLLSRFRSDRQTEIHRRDAWEALGALLPPAERRGLILIDPPYETPDEFARVVDGLRRSHARFPSGVFAVWYPIKHRAPVHAFFASIESSGIPDVVAAELWLRAPVDPTRLNGSALLVINPPHRFEEQARPILAALLDRLGDRNAGEGFAVARLADE
jgi:23S rRNA (adenine2030-N6)-methyltransferase